jgi:Tfp pilus assembly protein PilV
LILFHHITLKKTVYMQKMRIGGSNSGFTLVEVLVAAAVTAIAIISTIAMVRKADELNGLERHRQTAHALINGMIETVTYQIVNYNNLTAGTTVKSVVIDSRSGISGTLTITITDQNPGWTGTNAIMIPYKKIRFDVQWNEVRANNQITSEPVSVEKWLSP